MIVQDVGIDGGIDGSTDWKISSLDGILGNGRRVTAPGISSVAWIYSRRLTVVGGFKPPT